MVSLSNHFCIKIFTFFFLLLNFIFRIQIFSGALSVSLSLKIFVNTHFKTLNFTFVRHNVNRYGIVVMSIHLLAVILVGKQQHPCKTLYFTIFFLLLSLSLYTTSSSSSLNNFFFSLSFFSSPLSSSSFMIDVLDSNVE